ncbi:MAG: hemerythrin domain-containing protein [Methanomassiliicoccales archaeon]|jgi:iron-sulfur cluster repair protein YtfE (RIC family)
MSGPIDAVQCIHNAFRRDMLQIDEAAYELARREGDISQILTRFHVMGEILDYHARGEEAAAFPAVNGISPLFTNTYVMDHRELERLVSGVELLRNDPDDLTAARETAAMNQHLRLHLDKEDKFLYPLLRERLSGPEQASMIGRMSGSVPPEKSPMLVSWLYPLLDPGERAVMTGVWKVLMPPEVFDKHKLLIRKAIAGEWDDLVRRLPGLE